MKNNKKITVFLLVTLLGIWGTIVYQIINAVEADNSNEIMASPRERRTVQHKEDFEFDDRLKDPFKYAAPRVRKETVKTSAAQLWVPPPLKLTGIVTTGKKKVAVLEAPDGATYFVSEGESLNGVKMLKILDRSVRYEYQNQTRDWALN
jgi:Tfp pilus assembly protein PilP